MYFGPQTALNSTDIFTHPANRNKQQQKQVDTEDYEKYLKSGLQVRASHNFAS